MLGDEPLSLVLSIDNHNKCPPGEYHFPTLMIFWRKSIISENGNGDGAPKGSGT